MMLFSASFSGTRAAVPATGLVERGTERGGVAGEYVTGESYRGAVYAEV